MSTDRSSQAGLPSPALTLAPGAPTAAQRWLARLSFLLAALAVVILVVFAELNSLAILAVGVCGGGAGTAVGGVFSLRGRGGRRVLSRGGACAGGCRSGPSSWRRSPSLSSSHSPRCYGWRWCQPPSGCSQP